MCANCITQLVVICKLTEITLNPTINVFDERIKENRSQYYL